MMDGCCPQTVRNRLADGELRGEQVARGRGNTMWRVEIRSVQEYLERCGSPARRRETTSIAPPDQEIDRRLRRLEQSVSSEESPPGDQLDRVNLQFANLRLLEIQEKYEHAMRLLSDADNLRRRAQDTLASISAEYRSIIEQFLLPGHPPGE